MEDMKIRGLEQRLDSIESTLKECKQLAEDLLQLIKVDAETI